MLTIIFSYKELSKQSQFLSISIKPELHLAHRLKRADNAPILKYFITETSAIFSPDVCEQWLRTLYAHHLELEKIQIHVKKYGKSCSKNTIQKKEYFLAHFEAIKQKILFETQSIKESYQEIGNQTHKDITLIKLDLIDYLLHEEATEIDYAYVQNTLKHCVNTKYTTHLSDKMKRGYPLRISAANNVSIIALNNSIIPSWNSLTRKQTQQLQTLDIWIKDLNCSFDKIVAYKQLSSLITPLHNFENMAQQSQQDKTYSIISSHIAKFPSIMDIVRSVIKAAFIPISLVCHQNASANKLLVLCLLYTNIFLSKEKPSFSEASNHSTLTQSKENKSLQNYIHLAASAQIRAYIDETEPFNSSAQEHYQELGDTAKQLLKEATTFVKQVLDTSAAVMSMVDLSAIESFKTIAKSVHLEESGIRAVLKLQKLMEDTVLSNQPLHTFALSSSANLRNSHSPMKLQVNNVRSAAPISTLIALTPSSASTNNDLDNNMQVMQNSYEQLQVARTIGIKTGSQNMRWNQLYKLVEQTQYRLIKAITGNITSIHRLPRLQNIQHSNTMHVTSAEHQHKPVPTPRSINNSFLLKCLCLSLISCALIVLALTTSPAIVVDLGLILPFSVSTLQYAAFTSIAIGGIGLFTQSKCLSKGQEEPVASNRFCGAL